MKEELSTNYTCRICLEDNCPRSSVISPCACKGSSKWVHRECLDGWRITKEKAFSKCTECLQNYSLISAIEDTPKHRRYRQIEYVCYVTRDITLGLILLLAVIIAFALIVWSFDIKSKSLLTAFHSNSHPKLFYCFAGLILLLAVFGLLFMTHAICGRQLESCGECCPRGSCFDIYFISAYDNPFCCTCCCDNSCGALECGAGTLSGEIIIVLLFLFAILGLVLAIFAGILFVQQIIVKHMHILQKRGLAKDFIVADLAAEDIDIESADLNEGLELPNKNQNDSNIFANRNSRSRYQSYNPIINSESVGYEQMNRDVNESFVQRLTPSAPPLNPDQTQYLASYGLL